MEILTAYVRKNWQVAEEKEDRWRKFKVGLVEVPKTLCKPPNSNNGTVEIQGTKTAIIKAGICKLVYYLRHNVDTVISVDIFLALPYHPL